MGDEGGNPSPIVLDAEGMSDAEMQSVAQAHRLESGFILPPSEGSSADLSLRFWVPNHEMSMCGHLTVGALWLLRHTSRITSGPLTVETKSGSVRALVDGDDVRIRQPEGEVEPIDGAAETQVLEVLGLTKSDLATRSIVNARTSRTKTLVPVSSAAVLHAMQPDFSRVEDVCRVIGSTGLYPFVIDDRESSVFEARQFPASSGYREDAATGIAAAALVFGLLSESLVARDPHQALRVRQGRAMGRPSEITLRFAEHEGVWLGGRVI